MNNDRRLALVVAIAIAVVFVVFRFNFSPLFLFGAAALCSCICFWDLMDISLGLNPPKPNHKFSKNSMLRSSYNKHAMSSSSSAVQRGPWGKPVDLGPLASSAARLHQGPFYRVDSRRRLEAARRSLLPQLQKQQQTEITRQRSVLAGVMNTQMFQERLPGDSTTQRVLSNVNSGMVSPRVTVKIAPRAQNQNLNITSLIRTENSPVTNKCVVEALRSSRKCKVRAFESEDSSPFEKRERRDGDTPTPSLPNGFVRHKVPAPEMPTTEESCPLARVGLARKRPLMPAAVDSQIRLAKRVKTNEILCSYSSSRRISQWVKGRTRTIDRVEAPVLSTTHTEDVLVSLETEPQKEEEVEANGVEDETMANSLQQPSLDKEDGGEGPKSRKQRLGIYSKIKSPKLPDGVYVPSYLARVEDHHRDGLAARKRLSALMGTQSAQTNVNTDTTTPFPSPPIVNEKTPEAKDSLQSESGPKPTASSIAPLATTSTSTPERTLSIGGFNYNFGEKTPPKDPSNLAPNSNPPNLGPINPIPTPTTTTPSALSLFGPANSEETSNKKSESGFGVLPGTEALFRFGTPNPASTSVTFSNGTSTSLPLVSFGAPTTSSAVGTQGTSTEPLFRFGDVVAPSSSGSGGGFTFGMSPSPLNQSAPTALGAENQSGGFNFNFGAQQQQTPTFQFGAGSSGPAMFSTGTGSTLPRRRRQVGSRPRSHR